MNSEQALQIAKDAYSASTSYFDANFRKQLEDALRMFQSKHPLDSKYNSDAYKYRSKLFRPKTRSVIRKNEAAAATAYFSNTDVVNVNAVNEKNEAQVLAATMYKELLQHRLTKTIPWFLTVIGALQDALTVGVVCSHQFWSYKEKITSSKSFYLDEETGIAVMGIDGEPIYEEHKETTVLDDKPNIEIIPVENLRLDPGANWIDPINTSPYLIHLIPMYVGDLKQMGKDNPKTGEKGWDIPDGAKLLSATKQSYDSTRQVREGSREDSKDLQSVNDFSIVWVHKNIVRFEGEDFCYFTLGVEHLLCPPQPLKKYSPLKKRPYTMGIAIVETHKLYPSGYPELGKEVQKEINETTNSRQDNVRLVMNKRYIVKRGAQVDLKSLVRNVAASVTLANNPEGDVVPLEFNDVTSSAYQEQDRLNVEYDELTGNFSSSSVMTNRKLNETVGGMAMMGQGANQLTEYTLRTFTETWTEPTLNQLVELEKAYETDETLIKLIGDRMGTPVLDEMFDTEVELTVNVGMGATDPLMKLNKLLTGARAYAEIASMPAPGLNLHELGKEVFGYIGYRDGGRFIQEGDDPRVQQIKQEAEAAIQELQQKLQEAQSKHDIAAAAMEVKRDEAIAKLELSQEQADREHAMELQKLDRELREERARLNQELALERMKAHTAELIANEKANSAIRIAEEKAAAQIQIARENAEAQRKAAAVERKAEEKSKKDE